MSDKDLIFRGEVLARKCRYYVYDETGCCREEFAVPVEDINRISAAPHEMTAREFAEARDRLCDSMNMCTGCPIYKACLTDSLTKILPMVEAWVQEHPEEMQYCPDDDGSCSCADVDMRQEDEDAYGEHSYITMDEAVAYAEKWAREHSDERSEE